MANVIKHKRGSGSDPVASDLVVGEVAIRTDVGKLFTKMDNGSVAEIAGGGSDIAINTLSSSSATGGGSATFNGSAYRFTLSAPPSVSAQQLLVSINGVIQKPVAGTGQPSEGFSVDGNDIILGDAPASGSDFFILTFKSLGVSEPADNSVTSAKIVDGTITGSDLATNIDLVNNQKLRLGTGNDLQIYHDGTNSFIVNNDGDLLIRNTTGNEIKIQAVSGEQSIQCIGDGAVELYFDGSRKLRTRTAGVEIEGELGMADNYKIKLGTGEDLQIFHDGSDSFIKDTGTGALKICSNLFRVNNAANNEAMIKAEEDAGVTLSFDGSTKFETTSLGATLTGRLISDGLDVGDSESIRFGAGYDLQIFHDGSNSKIVEGGTGSLIIQTSNFNLDNAAGTENILTATENGGVELYHDNNKKFETVAGGVKTNDNNYMGFGNSNDLQISHDGSTNIINGLYHPIELRHQAEVHIKCVDDGAVELYHNNSKQFETTADGVDVQGNITIASANNAPKITFDENGANDPKAEIQMDQTSSTDASLIFKTEGSGTLSERMRIDSSGNIGIGTTDPGDNKVLVQLGDANTSNFKVKGGSGQGRTTFSVQAGNTTSTATTSYRLNDSSGNTVASLFFANNTDDLQISTAKQGGEILFNTSTTANSSGSVNRARFDMSGNFFLGKGSSDRNNTGVELMQNGFSGFTRNNGTVFFCNRGTNNGTLISLRRSNSEGGTISVTTTTASFNSNSSDRSLKKNFESWTENTLDLFKNLNPQKFNYIIEDDGAEKTKGYIAQDLVDSFPEAYPKNDNDKYMFNPSGMVVYLMKALQEAVARIEALEAK